MNIEAVIDCMAANESKYQSLLTAESDAAMKRDGGVKELRAMANPDRVRIATAVHTAATGRRAELVYAGSTPDDIEEYVLNIQGYIVRSKLPPIYDSISLGNNPRQASQSLTLSGLGTEVFEESVSGVLELYSHFSRHLPQGRLLPWKPRILNNKLCLDFHNRYFSSPQESAGQDIQDLSLHVDPLHILRKAVPQGIHTADNEVLYFERNNHTENETPVTSISPSGIAVGHLVEVQASFCAVPVKNNNYQFITKLRAICVLNRDVDTDTNKACIEKLKASCVPIARPLKRRVGYDTAPSSSAKRTRMDVSEDDVDNGMKELEI